MCIKKYHKNSVIIKLLIPLNPPYLNYKLAN